MKVNCLGTKCHRRKNSPIAGIPIQHQDNVTHNLKKSIIDKF